MKGSYLFDGRGLFGAEKDNDIALFFWYEYIICFIEDKLLKVDKFVLGKFVVEVGKCARNECRSKKRSENRGEREEAFATSCHYDTLR